MARTLKRKPNLGALTPERYRALVQFQEIYGDEWVGRMVDYHLGHPDPRGSHLSHYIRQIRNHVSANPADLPQPENKGDTR